MATTTLDYLVPYVRLTIGDTDSDAYRYLDEWLIKSLILAIKSLQRYWNDKYTVTEKGVVSRGTLVDPSKLFTTEESVGVIEDRDEGIIILKTSLIILGGSLENSAWNTSSWRDAEISYTNIEGGRMKIDNIKRLKADLDDLIKSPNKRLAWTVGYPLPGYTYNVFENKTEL